MKKGKFKAVIYLISFTVVVTLVIQVYRNWQNYQFNKQRLINNVQLSLDNAIEAYYADLAKDDTSFNIIMTDSLVKGPALLSGFSSGWVQTNHDHHSAPIDSVLQKLNFTSRDTSNKTVKIALNANTSFSDSVVSRINPSNISSIQVIADSVSDSRRGFRRLANQLVFSMVRPIDLETLSGYLRKQLENRGLALDFGLQRMAFGQVAASYNEPDDPRFVMSTSPKSTYQFDRQRLEMRFTNASLTILKRGLTDLIISLLISVTVIGVLLYLYRVISHQKQLAEIKNDLISNITHEFKTPIATVASAIEGISRFNRENDPEKTHKYLDISGQQLKKLNTMVEKLLETATLETDALQLNKTPVNLSQLIHALTEKYRLVSPEKQIDFEDYASDAIIEADAFHLENALSNLIDNAVKYGGDQIIVTLAHEHNTVSVVVQDNGGFIEKSQKEKVFDKFYRVPQGNRHDIKGFGIGLYYTRKIIEKHGGTIDLILSPNRTSFEVAI